MNTKLEYHPLDTETFHRLWSRIRHLVPASQGEDSDGLSYAREALEANLPMLAQSLNLEDNHALHGWLFSGRLERYERWLKFMQIRNLRYEDVMFALMILVGAREDTFQHVFQGMLHEVIEERIPASGSALIEKWQSQHYWKVVPDAKLTPKHFDLSFALKTGEGASWLSGICISALAQKLNLQAGCIALGGKLTLIAETADGLIPMSGAEPLAKATLGYLAQSLQRSPKLESWSAEPETILLAAMEQLLLLAERHHAEEAETIRKARKLSARYLRFIPESLA